MKPFTDDLSLEDFDEELSDMIRFGEEDTGVKYRIMLDPLGKERKRKNNSPRLMIDFDGHLRDVIPISIDKFNPEILIDREVQDFKKIANWIKKNYSIIMKHWNQEIDDVETIFLLCNDFRDPTKMLQFWKLDKIKNLEDLIIYPLLVKYWGQQKIDEVQALLNESEVD